MALWFFRLILILSFAGIGYNVSQLVEPPGGPPLGLGVWGILVGVGVAVAFIMGEMALARRPVHVLSSIVFGLVAGVVMAFILYGVIYLVVGDDTATFLHFPTKESLRATVLLILVTGLCYFGVSLIYKTRDRFRFIIPYVEFRKEMKGVRPLVLDTSAIVDGRIGEVASTGIIDGPLIVPKFVLQELHTLADSADGVRRRRGRRGLDMLQRLQRDGRVELQHHDGHGAIGPDVDAKVVSLATVMGASIVTCDYNLSKIAVLQGVASINLNDLANSLRPIALPGEDLEVKVIRTGDEPGQGVGFLPDGTMVVLERGRERVGQNVRFIVTSVLQTSAGRMIFGRPREEQSKDRQ
jgi:uncharacterized protein YacL